MNVLMLPRYSPMGASSRYRFYQYLPHLRQMGFSVTAVPLLDEVYLTHLYAGRRPPMARVLRSYLHRLRCLVTARCYDVVWLEKETLPWMPAIAEFVAAPQGVPFVADYDDATFHRYDRHPSPWVRLLLGGKIDRIMAGATVVVAGNDYLKQRAENAGARKVELMPTVIDLKRYTPSRPPSNDVFTIGWIGTPKTVHYLHLVQPALAEICRKYAARLVNVGGGHVPLDDIPQQAKPWCESGEVVEIQQFDVGIMPVPDEPWERGKCGLKLLQYMACGRPVIGSPVGVNQEIIEHEENGFLAATGEDWTRALSRLIEDKALRERLGRNARRTVEKGYSLAQTAPRLGEILRGAAAGNPA